MIMNEIIRDGKLLPQSTGISLILMLKKIYHIKQMAQVLVVEITINQFQTQLLGLPTMAL
ncbi:MAG: hypothetical protein GX203_04215 [Acholeplasmataceae bacterium]|nr:hypothetical protein [Acholeplasmataceae bacterium]